MNTFIAEVAQSILGGTGGTDYATASALVRESGGDGIYDLLYWANRIRIAKVGRDIKLCAIAAGKTGSCSEDCAFCGQSVHHPACLVDKRGQAAGQDIVSVARKALGYGVQSFGIVNSGRGPTSADMDRLAPILRQLGELDGLTVCASLGILSDSQAERLFQLGVRRYNHNLEASRRFFPRVVTTHSYDDRLATAQAVKRAGMSLCCGGIFGLGETMDDRLDIGQTLAEIGPDSVPLNFLHALDATPLAGATPMQPLDILRTIAIFRFMLPGVHIKVAGGREVNLRDLQSWIFFAGASGCVVGDYLLTSGRSAQDDLQMLADLELSTEPQRVGLSDAVKA
ncbi:MAG: biotin synthase BioB [Actinobacteria bacterium]|nr:biotin synthase BioB [Actinomycetota bacterium]